MPRRRPGINRWNKRLGIWMARRRADVDERRDQGALEAERAAAAAEAPTKVHHPAVRTPYRKTWRVVRYYRQHDQIQIEDISPGSRVAGPALLIMTRELGRARVLDPDGKVYADNLHAIEDRA
jgi:hypothetical protein